MAIPSPANVPEPGANGGSCRAHVAAPWPGAAWGMILGLVLLVGIAFSPVLGNDFVNWDDGVNFVNNPDFGGLEWAKVRWAFTTMHLGVYQPLAWVIMDGQAALGGVEPLALHLASVLLHAANTVVLFFLAVALISRCRSERAAARPLTVFGAAGLASALFAVHPLRVEVIAWASCQPYLPCALFFMLAILAYLRAHDRGPRRRWLLVSFILSFAALLCHAPAVTLPAALLILDIYPLRRLPGAWDKECFRAARQLVGEKVPFLVLSMIFMVAAVYARQSDLVAGERADAGVSSRILVPSLCICYYLARTLVPGALCNFHPAPTVVSWAMPSFLVSFLVVTVLTAGAVLLRRRRPGLLAGWLGFLVLLAPTMGLVRSGSYVIADHYCYLPLASLVVLGAGGLCSLNMERRRYGLAGAGVLLLAALAVLTWKQCLVWRTSETLWTHAIRHAAASSAGAYLNLGNFLVEQGQFEEGTRHLAEAVRLDPECPAALSSLGTALIHRERYEEAIALLAHAVQLLPDDAEVHHNLGFGLARLGRLAEAEHELAEAVRLKPAFAEAQNSLGLVWLRQGRLDDARAAFLEAIRLKADFGDALFGLGSVLIQLGRLEEAAGRLTEAIKAMPDHAEAHHNLGHVLAEQGKLAAAVARYAEAVRLRPVDAVFRNSLGLALTQQGRLADAVAQFDEAVRLKPTYGTAHNHLGVARALQGRQAEACTQFREALRLDPGDTDAQQNLARTLGQQPRPTRH